MGAMYDALNCSTFQDCRGEEWCTSSNFSSEHEDVFRSLRDCLRVGRVILE